MRWPDSTISGSFADNFIDDVQPHDEADFDGTQPISGPSGLVWLIKKKQLGRLDAENTVSVARVQRVRN